MKVIGANGDKRIVECDIDELARITGNRFSSSVPHKFPCGAEVNVSAIYSQYSRLISNRAEVKKIKDTCNDILKSVKRVEPVVERQAVPQKD